MSRGRAAARVGADAPAMGAGGRMPGPLRNPGQENSIKRDMLYPRADQPSDRSSDRSFGGIVPWDHSFQHDSLTVKSEAIAARSTGSAGWVVRLMPKVIS